VRVFKTKAFGRFQRKEHIDDKALNLDDVGIATMIAGNELKEVRSDG
jgi:hypothetical protein